MNVKGFEGLMKVLLKELMMEEGEGIKKVFSQSIEIY